MGRQSKATPRHYSSALSAKKYSNRCKSCSRLFQITTESVKYSELRVLLAEAAEAPGNVHIFTDQILPK